MSVCFLPPPSARNLYWPRLARRLLFRHIITAPQVWTLNQQGFDYATWFLQGGTLMSAYRDFFPWSSADLRFLFRPNADVRRLIAERTAAFAPVPEGSPAYSIGLHIRRTDHRQAIDESPLSLFTAAADHELDRHPDLYIYLATDDEPTKSEMLQRYGRRIITSPSKASRDSVGGIREAVVEMFALSRTRHIYGSAGSTFSPVAACLGEVPVTILRRGGPGAIDLLVAPRRAAHSNQQIKNA